MEENPWEFSSICAQFWAETMRFLEKAFSSLSSDPLFSTIVTLYTLILLYFPSIFLEIILSPVVIITGILLLTLLRLGAIQTTEKKLLNSTELQQTHHSISPLEEDQKWVPSESNPGSKPKTGSDPKPLFVESFVEWDVRAPLEVIYEEYEGEVEDEERFRDMCIERYPSLSLYYPESDSDSSSGGGDYPAIGGWDSPESRCFRWDEEDRDGLIEIELDGKRMSEVFHVEEDNLIEIDISPARTPTRNCGFTVDR